MNIHFSRHAKRQMKWRGISEDEVRRVISDPDKIEDSMGGRKNAFKRLGMKRLKVTFLEENDKIIMITAIDRSG